MPVPFAPLRRGPYERLAAWMLTGPLGHLWSVVADLLLLGLRLLRTWWRRTLASTFAA